MNTAKASISTPIAKRKVDKKDIDYLLHFLKHGYECNCLGLHNRNNVTFGRVIFYYQINFSIIDHYFKCASK